jgi:hypothetical protein
VVAERDHVGSRRQQALGELRRDADAVGGVLAVDDAETDLQLLAEAVQPLLERAPAGDADDVADEEELQRTDSVAAGRTSTATLWPASCVNAASA